MKDIAYKWPKSERVKTGGAFGSDDGLVEGIGESGKDFVENHERIVREDTEKRATWISQLRQLGVKGAHQDDGWHKRNDRYFTLCYPHFNDGIEIGDMVALGDYGKFVVVFVTEISGFFSKKYYYKSTIH